MKKTAALILAIACVLILFVGCGSKSNDAAYIYALNNGQREKTMATLTWDDLDALRTFTTLVNEAASSTEKSADTAMQYQIELVNADTDDDVFEIGFTAGMVCCTGAVQGITFDHAVSTSITEADLTDIIGQ
ncbi:MAG: hypothetical protein AB7D36_05355 [Oscillospiraceae bacterium]